jgi:ADP-ribosyl-[dinitrogen reductase] hydrolase
MEWVRSQKLTWEFLDKFRDPDQAPTLLGVHSDDCSMAKCLADSLLANGLLLDEIDLRIRFIYWWQYRYCNGSGSRDLNSHGIGMSISDSFKAFLEKPNRFVDNGNKSNSGNGSIMRLAPLPI